MTVLTRELTREIKDQLDKVADLEIAIKEQSAGLFEFNSSEAEELIDNLLSALIDAGAPESVWKPLDKRASDIIEQIDDLNDSQREIKSAFDDADFSNAAHVKGKIEWAELGVHQGSAIGWSDIA